MYFVNDRQRDYLFLKFIWYIVHLVGFHYNNISQRLLNVKFQFMIDGTFFNEVLKQCSFHQFGRLVLEMSASCRH